MTNVIRMKALCSWSFVLLLLEKFLRRVQTLFVSLRTGCNSPVHGNAVINYGFFFSSNNRCHQYISEPNHNHRGTPLTYPHLFFLHLLLPTLQGIGLASDIGTLTLGYGASGTSGLPKPPGSPRSRQHAWEQGEVDYLGQDQFDNIQKHIADKINKTATSTDDKDTSAKDTSAKDTSAKDTGAASKWCGDDL